MKLPRKLDYFTALKAGALPSAFHTLGGVQAMANHYAFEASILTQPLAYMKARDMARRKARASRECIDIIFEAIDRNARRAAR